MTKTIRLLNNPWYHEFIRDTMNGLPEEASPDAHAKAMAMLTSAAMIAQAIDNAFGHTASSTSSGSKSVVESLDKALSNERLAG